MKLSSNFRSRLAISTGVISSLFLLLALSQLKGFGWIFPATIAGASSLALYEYVSLCKKKDVFVSFPMLAISSTIFFFSRYFVFVDPRLYFLPPLVLFLTAALFVINSLSSPQGSLTRLAHTIFGFCFIPLPLSWMIDIFALSPFWFLWLIATVKGGDIAAYAVGKTLGKHLLAERVSPKKTIEGALASILGSALIGIAFSSHAMPLKNFFTLGSAMGMLAILGDLAESLIKRDANVKDSSTIPGLGGVLDMLDSLFFATPCLYFYLKIMHLFYL